MSSNEMVKRKDDETLKEMEKEFGEPRSVFVGGEIWKDPSSELFFRTVNQKYTTYFVDVDPSVTPDGVDHRSHFMD